MMLPQRDAALLVQDLEARVADEGCDHTLSKTRSWVEDRSIDWDDVLDILEQNGCFCDCEVMYNLPTDHDVEFDCSGDLPRSEDPYLIPEKFQPAGGSEKHSIVLVADPEITRNCYAPAGEIVVPAPKGAKPKKRVRRSVHFFVGIESGLPAEAAVARTHDPVTPGQFAKMVRDAGCDDLKSFGLREAAFYLARAAKIRPGKAAGTHFSEVTGLTARREELRIHRVFIRR